MSTPRYSRFLRTISLLLIVALFCPSSYGKVISVDDDGQADFDNIQAALDDANDGDMISVKSGTYDILSDIVVDANCSLQIDPGTRIQFAHLTGLTVEGVLQAQGTVDEKIIFTSNSEVPKPGDWNGIRNYGVSREMSLLDFVEISFATTGVDINAQYGSPMMVVQNSEIHDNNFGVNVDSRPGKSISAENVQINSNRIYSNTYDGIDLTSYSNRDSSSENSSYVGDNEIYHNRFGIHLYADNGNNWGSASSTVTCEITGNHIYGNDAGIFTATEQSLNKMKIAAKIVNNVITGNSGYGLSLLKGSGEKLYPQVTNNTIFGNGLAGISHHEQPSEGFTVTNNIIAGNGTGVESRDVFDPISVTDCIVAYNNVFDNENGNWVHYPDAYGDLVGINQNGSPCDIAMNISEDPCFADPGYWSDPCSTSDNLYDDVWIDGDYHLKSQAGRWDPVSESWAIDDVTSPCIDSGDPGSDWAGEVWPHGERINMGAYGGTPQASISTQPQAMSLPDVAYIHLYDTEATESFRSFLMAYACPVTMISLNDVTSVPLDSYDLIIVGNDTGSLSNWNNNELADAIEASGKPILGLGEGGYAFFGKLELSIGWPHGMHGEGDSLYAVDPNSPLFDTPYRIDIPEDEIIQLYTESGLVLLYLWPPPEPVKILGRAVGHTGYYPLVIEHDRYVFWGFTESPLKMTEDGKRLFINTVIRTANMVLGN